MRHAKVLSAALIASLPLSLAASYYTSGMMPPEGKLTKIGLVHAEGLAGESASLNDKVQASVETHLKAAGVEVAAPESLSDADAQKLLGLQQKFEALFPKIKKHPKDLLKSSFTLGSEVASVSCAAKSDVLVFVEAEGQLVTTNRVLLGAIFRSGPTDNTGQVYVTFVDAKSGEVVGFVRINHVYIRDSIYDPDKTYGTYFDKEFNKMKLGGSPLKPA